MIIYEKKINMKTFFHIKKFGKFVWLRPFPRQSKKIKIVLHL